MKRATSLIFICTVVLCLLSTGVLGAKEADKYPSKGIDIIVSVSAGGAPDVMSRIAAEWLSKYWGKPVTVINKPGGGAIPGVLEVLSATADGYTVGTITSQNSSQQHGANKKPTIDVNKPTYIARAFDVDLVLTVNANSEWKDIKAFSNWALANPDKLVWANTGTVSTASFSTAEWYSKIGGDISKTRMMTTSGGADSATKLAAGNCVMNFGDFLSSASMVRAGKVRYLATSAKKRNPYFPDVPTMEENGIKGLSVGMWVGFMMPNGTPDFVVNAWDTAIQKMIVDEGFLKKLSNLSGRTAYLNATDFRKLIMQECTTYTALAEQLGVRK
jgi:tripartite-type tricarboxylate transporter receptor subunit TctC